MQRSPFNFSLKLTGCVYARVLNTLALYCSSGLTAPVTWCFTPSELLHLYQGELTAPRTSSRGVQTPTHRTRYTANGTHDHISKQCDKKVLTWDTPTVSAGCLFHGFLHAEIQLSALKSAICDPVLVFTQKHSSRHCKVQYMTQS